MASQRKQMKIDEEARLTKLLFNDASGLVEKFTQDDNEENSDVGKIIINNEKDAWHDDDDDINVGAALDLQGRKLPNAAINDYSGKYAELVKHKYKLLVGTPEWAKLNKNFDEDSDEEILQTVGHLAKKSVTSLPIKYLEYKRLRYLNLATGNEGPIITTVEFHPTSSVALVAGVSGIASLLTVNGNKNEKLHTIAFKRYPIHCGRFSHDGSEAYLGSTFPHFFTYDLMNAKALRVPLPNGITTMKMFEISHCGKFLAIAGRFGEVHLLCAKSKELIKTLKQNGLVTALAFSSDSTKLFCHSKEGQVSVWNISSLRVFHKWADDGCISGSSLAMSPSGEYIATGSSHGVVNVYATADVLSIKEPKPRRILKNLKTKISGMRFNSSSELLAFHSSDASDAVRFVHIPSYQVFTNFPGLQPNLGHVSVVNFSPNSGYVSLGNNKKLVYLYRLKHYKNY